MKRISIVAFLLVIGLKPICAPVNEQTARLVAETFWKQISDRKASFVTSQTAFSEFYVFNNQIGEGFILVSADNIAHPILGYSEENKFRTDIELAPNINAWFTGISKEISTAVAAGVTQSEAIAEEWNNLIEGTPQPKRSTRAVSPLIHTKWDQDSPYNNLCPGSGYNKAVTGCVATAMAQVMKFWNYPTTGNGSHSYVCNNSGYGNYGTLSADFGNTTYDWSNMPNTLSTYSPSTQKNAVATLMYHCGVAVEMKYGTISSGGSGAFTINFGGQIEYSAEDALVDFFKYATSVFGRQKSRYTDSSWKKKLMEELNAGRPMVYSGDDNESGHCFVCDGYNNDTLFHFNWGWSGSNDGYYALNAMTPGGGGIGGGSYDFSCNQEAITGIEPPRLTVDQTTMHMVSEGERKTFDISTNTSWTISCSESWLTVRTASGNNNKTVTTIAAANPSTQPRTATITISADFLEPKTITVTQDGSPASVCEENVDKFSVYPNPTSGSFTINFNDAEGEVIYQFINANGSIVESRTMNIAGNKEMTFNYDIAKGIYFVRVISDNNVWTKQIAIE